VIFSAGDETVKVLGGSASPGTASPES